MSEKKMIDRFVIKNVNGKIVKSIEEFPNPNNCFNVPDEYALRIFDREEERTITKIDSRYLPFNFAIAEAVVTACDEYEPPVLEEGTLAGDDSGDDTNGGN